MKADILLLDRFSEMTESRLDEAYATHRLYRADGAAALLEKIAPRIRAIATSGAKGAGNAIIDALPALEIVAIRGVGTDGVDLDRARKRGLKVTTTPNLLTEDVADLAIGLMLATCRQICVGDRFLREGKWRPGTSLPLATKVAGKRMGIVGLGRVGRAIARRAEGFAMDIAYTDIGAIADAAYRFVPKLADLAAGCDVLVLAASGGPQSRGIVDRTILDALGPKGFLINVARGSLVDEPALVAALVEGRLAGAGLDVFADEPNVPPVLFGLDNVVLQPHRASATAETRAAMEDLVLANLAAHFAGRPLPSEVV